jgi:hypothetical protein
MALTTLAEALTQFNENILWMGSQSKAQLFYEAAVWLDVNRPARTSDGGASVDYDGLKPHIDKVEAYLKAVNPNRASFTRGVGVID